MSLIILDDMIIDESGGDSHENKRVKITTACDTCRRRKVKCDGESPCANCQRGSYQCSFSDSSAKRPRGPPKGFVALIEDRLHTIESLLVNLVNKDNVADISALTKNIKRERLDSALIEGCSCSLISQRQEQHFNTFKNVSSKHNHLFNPCTPDSDYSDVSQGHPGYANEMTIEDGEILQDNLVYPNASNTLQSNTLSFLTIEDNDNNIGLSDYVEPSLPTLTVNLKPVPDEIYKQLFDKYFDLFHPCFPIVNRGNFFRSLNGLNVENQLSKLLIEAICAIGAMFIPNTKQDDEYSSQFFYERAKNLLENFVDVPRLSTIQALILLCMVDQGKPSTYRSQSSASIAIRMAQSIGLNRKDGAAYQGAKDRQSKKLAWWGCFVLDRLNSLNTGNPLIINDKVCDIELPSPDEMDESDEAEGSSQNQNLQSSTSTFSSTSRGSNYRQQINIFISYIRIMKLTGQILDHLQTISCAGLQASLNHHAIIDIFESLLSDWSRELPPFLNYVSSAQNLPLPGQIASLHMHHQALYLLLYYPYLAEYGKLRRGDRNVRTSKTFAKSMNICSAAANRITNIGVDALNNINTCIAFPAIFYCLGKAAKVHSINILSQQRGLAINSYKNIIKTVKICKFYKQNNIMKELAQKTISLLENILIKYQDKFSHEEIFGITPTGEIVNPDGLDLTLSSFGLNSNGIGSSSSNNALMTPITQPPRVKITSSNQIYSEPFEGTNDNSKSVPSIILTSPADISQQKSNDPSNQIQQANTNFNFIQGDNERDQQFNLTPDSLFVSQIIQATTPTSEQFCWDMVDEGFDNTSYENITPTNSINVTSPIQTSMAPTFSQPQRTQSLPSPTSSQLDQFTNNFNRSKTISSHSRSPSHLSVDSAINVIHTSPISSPTLQQSQRYVFMGINDNNEGRSNSFTSENNNGFVTSEGSESSSVYDGDNSRVSFHNRTSYLLTPTTTPTSSRSRSPFSSSSELTEKETRNNTFASGLYLGASDELDNEAATILNKRLGNCGITNAETSMRMEYGGINNINNGFDITDIGGGLINFGNGGT